MKKIKKNSRKNYRNFKIYRKKFIKKSKKKICLKKGGGEKKALIVGANEGIAIIFMYWQLGENDNYKTGIVRDGILEILPEIYTKKKIK